MVPESYARIIGVNRGGREGRVDFYIRYEIIYNSFDPMIFYELWVQVMAIMPNQTITKSNPSMMEILEQDLRFENF